MPCYRCGARQTDPDHGASPWRRGVRGTEQVLICPQCQITGDWTTDLDRCRQCGSTALVRRLGQIVCRDCDSIPIIHSRVGGYDGLPTPPEPADPGDDALAVEVAAAIDRVLGRQPAAASAGSSATAREVP